MLDPKLDSLREERVLSLLSGMSMDSATNRFRRQTALRTAHERSSPAGWNLELALFLVDFKIQDDVLATVEAGDRAGRRLGAFLFRVQFIIGIRIQTAEAVAAGVIGVTAADGIGPHVSSEKQRCRKRGCRTYPPPRPGPCGAGPHAFLS